VKAFITGITGFAGSHLAEHLLRCGDEVVGCSRDGRWKGQIPATLVRDIPLFAWDVTRNIPDSAKRQLIALKPDCVYHLAAMSVPKQCGADEPTEAAWNANVLGTLSLVGLVASLPKRPRVLLASSCHVYAPVNQQDPFVNEEAPLGPVGAYGKSKLAAEQELLGAVRDGKVDGVIARPFKHAGPRQNPRLMLPEWCIQMADGGGQPVRVLNMDSHFDITDARDVVRAYRLLAAGGRRGEVYNVGSGISRRSGDLVEQLRQVAGTRGSLVELSPGVKQEPIADISRLQQLTGWRPDIPLQKTLSDTLAYWRERNQARIRD